MISYPYVVGLTREMGPNYSNMFLSILTIEVCPISPVVGSVLVFCCENERAAL